jgi:metal-sulfur cluster biosynthetic enzyme
LNVDPNTPPAPPQAILAALSTVYDPCCREKGISVVDMGLIESVAVDAGNARVELVLTSGWCPFAVDLLDAVRARIASLDGMEGVEVDIRWDRPWGAHRLSAEARRRLAFLPAPSAVGDRHAFLAAQGARRISDPEGESR